MDKTCEIMNNEKILSMLLSADEEMIVLACKLISFLKSPEDFMIDAGAVRNPRISGTTLRLYRRGMISSYLLIEASYSLFFLILHDFIEIRRELPDDIRAMAAYHPTILKLIKL